MREVDRVFRRTLRALRAECPMSLKVRVRVRRTGRRHADELFGWVSESRDGRHLNLTIRDWVRPRAEGGRLRRQLAAEVRETLVHEWAHAMAWTPEGHPNTTDHDAAFGIAYSRAYGAVVED